jgi:hypothetical protein
VPQDTAQGPLQFLCYAGVNTVFDHHGVQHHTFADDKQVYVSGTRNELNSMRRNLADCFGDTTASRRLQLSSDESDVIWFASRANRNRLASNDLLVNCDTQTEQPSRSMRDVGVQLDDELSMVQHVSSVTRTRFHHSLRQILHYVGEGAAGYNTNTNEEFLLRRLHL